MYDTLCCSCNDTTGITAAAATAAPRRHELRSRLVRQRIWLVLHWVLRLPDPKQAADPAITAATQWGSAARHGGGRLLPYVSDIATIKVADDNDEAARGQKRPIQLPDCFSLADRHLFGQLRKERVLDRLC